MKNNPSKLLSRRRAQPLHFHYIDFINEIQKMAWMNPFTIDKTSSPMLSTTLVPFFSCLRDLDCMCMCLCSWRENSLKILLLTKLEEDDRLAFWNIYIWQRTIFMISKHKKESFDKKLLPCYYIFRSINTITSLGNTTTNMPHLLHYFQHFSRLLN